MNARHHAPRRGLTVGALSLALVVTAFQPSSAAESSTPTVNPGDTIAEVVAKIGRPKGSIEGRNRITYSYDRGMVNFIDGRVASAFLVTPEEAEQRRAEQARAAEANRRQDELQRERLLVEGQTELRKQKDDPTFNKRTATERLAYWEDFQRRYPFTDVSTNLTAARSAVTAEVDRRTKEDEVKTLSARIEAIQARRVELDAAYAASLANWKRTEIDAERAKLAAELEHGLRRLVELQSNPSAVNSNTAATTAAGR